MKIAYAERVGDWLCTIDDAQRVRIVNKMKFFADQPDPLKHAKHLVGYNAYRFRVGDYRVVCRVVDEFLLVLLIDKRDGVYKGL